MAVSKARDVSLRRRPCFRQIHSRGRGHCARDFVFSRFTILCCGLIAGKLGGWNAWDGGVGERAGGPLGAGKIEGLGGAPWWGGRGAAPRAGGATVAGRAV